MIATARYGLAVLLHSQRYLPPLFVLILALAVLTSSGSGSILPAYAVAGGAVFACAAWLALAFTGSTGRDGRDVLATAAGGPGRAAAGSALAVLASTAALTAVGLAYPALAGGYTVTPGAVLVGAAALAGCGCTGAAVGLLARPVLPGRGAGLLAAVALVLVWLLVPWLPPVHPLLRLLAERGAAPSGLALPVAGLLLTGAALFAGAAALAHRLAARRR